MTEPRKVFYTFIVLALIFLMIPQNSRGLLRKVELPEMVSRAGTIVHGTVLTNECREDERGAIFTYTTIRVAEIWAGDVADGRIVIRNMGGKVGDRELRVSDIPEFQPGEDVILFIEKEPLVEETCLVGWEQGKYRVQAERVERTGQTVGEFKTEVSQLLAAKESN